MQKLYFNFNEFFNSDVAKAKGIENKTDNPRILTNWMNLVFYVLNPARIKLNAPINIEGAFRVEALRKELKAAKTGHPDGECADLSSPVLSKYELFNFLRTMAAQGEIEYDQLILEYNPDGSICVHVGYRHGANRKQTLVRKYKNGKYIYTAV